MNGDKAETIFIEVYRKGKMMYATLGSPAAGWRPVAISAAIDPEARTFVEGVRQLVVKLMQGKLTLPIP